MATLSLRHILLSLLLFTLSHLCKSQDNAEHWKIFSLGDPALHINLPGEVIPKETALPVDLINKLQRFDTFRFYHAEGKLVAVMKFTHYNIPIEEPVGALLDTEVTYIMKSIHAEEVLQQEKDFSLHKYPGRKSTGRFMMDNKAFSFQDVLLKKDNSIWQVWVAADESDPASVKMMKKIVKGIKF